MALPSGVPLGLGWSRSKILSAHEAEITGPPEALRLVQNEARIRHLLNI